MKKILVFCAMLSSLLCNVEFNVVYAQLKVKGDNGKVIVGQDRIENGLIEDPYNVLAMSLF